MNFHIFHAGLTGKQFTCKYVQGTGFTELDDGSCDYVKDQIEVLNKGFAGVNVDNLNTLYNDNTKFQFCLQGANDVRPSLAEYDNSGYYNDSGSYKSTFRRGQMETLNVWVNTAGGYLGYATFPTPNFSSSDGVVLLGTSVS